MSSKNEFRLASNICLFFELIMRKGKLKKLLVVKILIYACIFLLSSLIGILISRKSVNRVKELMEFKSALNIFKTKVKLTHAPVAEIFTEISRMTLPNVAEVFKKAQKGMKTTTAGEAWRDAIDAGNLNIVSEDKDVLKGLSKLLGKTDLEGQIAAVELTTTFLEEQILKAQKEKDKSEKMYKTLGMIFGIGIVIILM